jgi:hypothetical protein
VYRQRRTGKVFKGFSFEPNPRNPGWGFQLPTARRFPNEARSQAIAPGAAHLRKSGFLPGLGC